MRRSSFFWIAAIAGFPLALVFGWRYDITSQGILRTPPADPDHAPDLSLKTADFVILGMFAIVAGYAAYGIYDELGRIESETAITRVQTAALNTIAVLPLQNLSGNDDQFYLSAGMHDALITSLSKISSLRVTSRTSANNIDRELSVTEIGNVLNVARILDGSVTREGDTVRINVQLIDAETDEHIWAESYDRDFSSLIAMQNEIARRVARAVQAKVTPEEQIRLSSGQSVNPDSYDAFLRGMFQLHKESPEGYQRGIEIMMAAVENDPTSALAYAGLAYGHSKLGHNAFGVEGAAPRARAAAMKALEFDDTLSQAHLAMGMYYLYYEWDWENTEKYLHRAIELNPSLTEAHYHLAWYYELFADTETALYHGEKTVELDPLSPFMTAWLGDQYRQARMYDKALAATQTATRFSPDFAIGWLVQGMIQSEIGQHDEALASHARLAQNPAWSWGRGISFANAGYSDQALAVITELGDEPRAALVKTLIYAALADREQTLYWMKETRDGRQAWYPWVVNWFPMTRFMYNDPQWQAYAEEINLEFPEI